ncbi:hypothetical protein CB1_000917024 [Camelus ferus]|nr:hypothetical protein CB1_000917024 [Camelus ferus]
MGHRARLDVKFHFPGSTHTRSCSVLGEPTCKSFCSSCNQHGAVGFACGSYGAKSERDVAGTYLYISQTYLLLVIGKGDSQGRAFPRGPDQYQRAKRSWSVGPEIITGLCRLLKLAAGTVQCVLLLMPKAAEKPLDLRNSSPLHSCKLLRGTGFIPFSDYVPSTSSVLGTVLLCRSLQAGSSGPSTGPGAHFSGLSLPPAGSRQNQTGSLAVQLELGDPGRSQAESGQSPRTRPDTGQAQPCGAR